ncbi:MAG TPA: RagB/SusD family nutrient uptake outer membrane protein [Chryseolinea sp.]|nr:RagB/SusD family nutrient uptake outer membrane protein [Chryseolinea sp.]
MKKYITPILSAFLLITTISCEDYLEKPPYGVLTVDNFYKTPAQLSQGLTDAYNYLGSADFETPLFILGNIVTDDSEKGGSDVNDFAAAYELSRFRAVASNSVCLQLWSTCYKGVFNSNIVIEEADALQDMNPELVNRIRAEAKFLRGLYYFNLATAFGGVPLILSPLAPSEADAERASFEATWDQIEKDFSEAAAVLPLKAEYSASDLGRATSGAANVMLAKAHLMRQKYSEAESTLEKVVSSNQYALVDDFGKIFTSSFENGAESVFEIQHKNTQSSGGSEGTGVNRYSWSRKNGGWGFDCPTEDLKNEFEVGDPRLIYTFTFTGDIFDAGDVTDNTESPTGYHNRKVYLSTSERDNPINDQSYNIRYLRYADVLLLYAEVLNENGKAEDALIYLNIIRDRARDTSPFDPRRTFQTVEIIVNLPSITTTDKDELRDLIWHERRVELALEYHRKFDLVRQQRYGDVMRTYAANHNSDKGSLFNDSYHDLIPIPAEEIDRSQQSIGQNLGY